MDSKAFYTTVHFRTWACYPEFTHYNNGRHAIRLHDKVDSSPVATASVNLPDELIDDDCVFIKTWSENEGMLEALVEAGIVEETGRTVEAGWAVAHECRLL